MNTQVRSDTFVTQNNRSVRVQLQKDHIASSNLLGQLTFETTVMFPPNTGRDALFDKYMPDEEKCAPVHAETVDITVDDLILNKSVTQALLKPKAATNAWVHSLREQAQILPYVTEDRIKQNCVVKQTKNVALTGWTDAAGVAATEPVANRDFLYYPMLFGKFLVGDANETQIFEKCAVPEMPVVPGVAGDQHRPHGKRPFASSTQEPKLLQL